ncbi:MAG: IreB family regulatory phosphoprotein [Stomatobaculum sp.]
MNENLHDTQFFQAIQENKMDVSEVLRLIYEALSEKGYNPVNQIVGYVMSGDPTYITSHKNARSLIMKVERDDILEELLSYYIDNKLGGGQ